ncbi:endo alpha-1,4 polygalactosaminidase [Thalassolituus sp. UBA1505]|uniref:endo alpha-1,4 polygalactosaminidase n=1 Tax=Thalassolituus sp. UBA1505 TaxID=1947653 RepID=UPI0025FC41FB|nr:endo alpha-1,4 polygalactosaminidase [Thalassolituus sp. UBA1505]
MSWYWQLSGDLNTGYSAEIYDIDLFDNSASVIADLQAGGHKVICYFSGGSYEDWRGIKRC